MMKLNLNDFELQKVINEDVRMKYLALHLKPKIETETVNENEKESNTDAILLLQKLPFNSFKSFSSQISNLKFLDSNDIYHRFINQDYGIEAKLIYPATGAHLTKYTEQHRKVVLETPEMHAKITRPHFESLRLTDQITWIQNIINNTSETERRLFDNQCPLTGFVILPDYKWTDESNINGFYLLAIPRRNDLWSVRDLSGEHLPLLEEIRKELMNLFCASEVGYAKRFIFPDGSPISYNHLRVFFHYPPTYPHLHIHITLASSSAYPACAVGQAILLDEVIDNLKMVSSDYYCKLRTLPMEFGEEHELYLKLKNFQ